MNLAVFLKSFSGSMRIFFEFSIAIKYLLPRRKQLSVTLISLLSVAVISLVVWLVLVFLSVTEGIERTWLHKLTSLNAPLRITPTSQYYSSYYYQIDSVSALSQFSYKNIAEKIRAERTDPFNPEEDGELPVRFPAPDLDQNQSLKDPVKGLFALLNKLKISRPDLTFQDYEMSGALMRLQLLRQTDGMQIDENQSYLTQVSYLASLPDRCPEFSKLLIPPSEKDVNHALYLATHATEFSRQDTPNLSLKAQNLTSKSRIQEILSGIVIHELTPKDKFWQLPMSLIPENKPLKGFVRYHNAKLTRIDIPAELTSLQNQNLVKIYKKANALFLDEGSSKQQQIPLNTPLVVQGSLSFNVKETLSQEEPFFRVNGTLQGVSLSGEIGLKGLQITKLDFKDTSSVWYNAESGKSLPLNQEKETGVLLAKSFLDNGVLIGDRGYLSYSSTTASSVQEHRLPIFVAGFYDPGILSVGNKCILVPSYVTQTINASNSSFNLDKTQSNGFLVWFKELKQAQTIKQEIVQALKLQGLDRYWKVTTFYEYDFARDLMQQFQSDKYLFALVGILILVVACCNVISLLVLLVNDKKREIGILQAMGARPISIAAIFGICGMAMGILSSIIGTLAALLTMHNIDAIAKLLSLIQGQQAFNTAFFGKSLPSELSHEAVLFILITTPLISLLAGLVPAIKACRMRPSSILRSE